MTYEEIRVWICQNYPGHTFQSVDEMSWDQINGAVREGKPDRGIPVHTAAEVHEIAKNWRKYVGI